MNRKKLKSKRLGVTIAALFCALALSVPPISAYYESTTSAKNTATIGDVSVQMIDKLANPVQGITPLKEYKRCPYVQNAGVNDAYVFVVASIPYRSAILAEADGMNDGDKVNTELFSINATADWMLLSSSIQIKLTAAYRNNGTQSTASTVTEADTDAFSLTQDMAIKSGRKSNPSSFLRISNMCL